MSQAEGPLDFTLRWTESDAPRDSGHDSVSVGGESAEHAEAVGVDDSRVVEDDSDGWDDHDEDAPVEADGEDDFQWSAEREAELEEAFESIPADAPARVHLQLNDISSALKGGSLSKERALGLISEVEAYLSARIKAEQRKSPVDHEAFMSYRAGKLNALYAWQETATALREFCTAGEDVQLRVAQYSAEQASDFLHNAWDTLQSVEPEPEEDGEFDDDEDEDESDLYSEGPP